MAFSTTILWLVVNVEDPHDGDKADVGDIGGCGNDDGDKVDKRQEELLPTTEVLVHVIKMSKKRNKHGHWGEDKADCETAKDSVAVLEQPQPVQDVAYEVKQGECQFCEKM